MSRRWKLLNRADHLELLLSGQDSGKGRRKKTRRLPSSVRTYTSRRRSSEVTTVRAKRSDHPSASASSRTLRHGASSRISRARHWVDPRPLDTPLLSKSAPLALRTAAPHAPLLHWTRQGELKTRPADGTFGTNRPGRSVVLATSRKKQGGIDPAAEREVVPPRPRLEQMGDEIDFSGEGHGRPGPLYRGCFRASAKVKGRSGDFGGPGLTGLGFFFWPKTTLMDRRGPSVPGDT